MKWIPRMFLPFPLEGSLAISPGCVRLPFHFLGTPWSYIQCHPIVHQVMISTTDGISAYDSGWRMVGIGSLYTACAGALSLPDFVLSYVTAPSTLIVLSTTSLNFDLGSS